MVEKTSQVTPSISSMKEELLFSIFEYFSLSEYLNFELTCKDSSARLRKYYQRKCQPDPTKNPRFSYFKHLVNSIQSFDLGFMNSVNDLISVGALNSSELSKNRNTYKFKSIIKDLILRNQQIICITYQNSIEVYNLGSSSCVSRGLQKVIDVKSLCGVEIRKIVFTDSPIGFLIQADSNRVFFIYASPQNPDYIDLSRFFILEIKALFEFKVQDLFYFKSHALFYSKDANRFYYATLSNFLTEKLIVNLEVIENKVQIKDKQSSYTTKIYHLSLNDNNLLQVESNHKEVTDVFTGDSGLTFVDSDSKVGVLT